MNLETLTEFFKWGTIVAMVVYAWSAVMTILASDFIFGWHKKWFAMSRQTFNVAIYAYLGTFKIFLILFFLVPYLALLLLGR